MKFTYQLVISNTYPKAIIMHIMICSYFPGTKCIS